MKKISHSRTLLWLSFILLLCLTLACNQERKSQGEKPQNIEELQNKVKDGIMEVDGYQHVMPDDPAMGNVIPNDRKAQRVINQLTNYTIAISSQDGQSPENLDELKPKLKSLYQLNWPKDPWGNPYNYEKTGEMTFEISSFGPDKEPKTNDDIKAHKENEN